jgi:hypothetical protein
MTRTSILTAACIATVALISALWPSVRIPGVVTTVHANHQGWCSEASLRGTYAFQRTGINTVAGGPVAIVGIHTYNGDGTSGASRQAASRQGVIQDWTDVPPGGTYTVDSDCTGSVFDVNGTKTEDLVVIDGGNEVFLISTLPGRIITTIDKKLEARDRD